MNAFPDTSFLCALYREQENSDHARTVYRGLNHVLEVSPAVAYEFRQSVRLQVYLHSMDRTRGFGRRQGDLMVAAFQSDLVSGALAICPCDWGRVFTEAERISASHTMSTGTRSWDTLHVATARHLEAKGFLSFDTRQRALALACGLRVAPK